MNETARPQTPATADRASLLEIVRVLLLLQGAVLLATTLEAFLFGLAFMGTPGLSFLLSGSAALAVLVGRARLRPEPTPSARVIQAIEVVLIITFAIDLTLALFITRGAPPAVAVLTRFALPVAVIALLRRSTGAARRSSPARIAIEGGA